MVLPPPRTRSASSTLSLCFFPCGSTAWARTVVYRDAGSNMAGMLIDRSASGLEEPGKLVCCHFFLNILNSIRGVFQQTEQESRQRIAAMGLSEKKKEKKSIYLSRWHLWTIQPITCNTLDPLNIMFLIEKEGLFHHQVPCYMLSHI